MGVKWDRVKFYTFGFWVVYTSPGWNVSVMNLVFLFLTQDNWDDEEEEKVEEKKPGAAPARDSV